MRLRPTRIANADAALPARHRNRRPTNAASAKAREAWPLGKEGSNSASQPYPMRVRTLGRTPVHGRGLPTRNLIPSVRTTVIPRSRRKSNVASRYPRHHRGTAKSTMMNAAPSVVITTMRASIAAFVPAALSARNSTSSRFPTREAIATGTMRPDGLRRLKPAGPSGNPHAPVRHRRPVMDRVQETFDRLLAHYGPQGWWPADPPFEAIVGALLMPQTAWRNVATAIRNLKGAGLLEVHALAAAPVAVIRRHVRIAGLHRTKPARLKAFCRHLVEESDGDLATYFNRPTEVVRADLLAQDGVGPETADSILLYAGRHPVFVVDAYTIRIGGRIGLFDTAEYGAVQRFFETHVPPDLAGYQEYHALLVAHAKTLCRHADPACDVCPLQSLCDLGRSRKR